MKKKDNLKGVVVPFYNALRHKLLKLDHKKGMVTILIEDRGERIQQFETLLSQLWSELFIHACPWCVRDLNNLIY
jgi:hypothetical protein